MRFKSQLLAAVALAASLFLAIRSVSAQQAASGGQGTSIAVIDVGFVVKNHPAIKMQQEAIRNRVKAAQEELGKRRQELLSQAEKLKSYNEGTPEFNKLQEALANGEAQLKLDTVRKEKELDEDEAKMAIQFYQQLQSIINQLADHYKIDIVLRSNREPPDIKQPATIQMALEKGVVFSRPNLDLTDAVIQMLGQQQPVTQGTNPAAVSAGQTNANMMRK